MKKLKTIWRKIKIFFFYTFGETSSAHPDMSYYYDIENDYLGDVTCYRKHNKKYQDNTLNDENEEKEADFMLFKGSDIFDM